MRFDREGGVADAVRGPGATEHVVDVRDRVAHHHALEPPADRRAEREDRHKLAVSGSALRRAERPWAPVGVEPGDERALAMQAGASGRSRTTLPQRLVTAACVIPSVSEPIDCPGTTIPFTGKFAARTACVDEAVANGTTASSTPSASVTTAAFSIPDAIVGEREALSQHVNREGLQSHGKTHIFFPGGPQDVTEIARTRASAPLGRKSHLPAVRSTLVDRLPTKDDGAVRAQRLTAFLEYESARGGSCR